MAFISRKAAARAYCKSFADSKCSLPLPPMGFIWTVSGSLAQGEACQKEGGPGPVQTRYGVEHALGSAGL